MILRPGKYQLAPGTWTLAPGTWILALGTWTCDLLICTRQLNWHAPAPRLLVRRSLKDAQILDTPQHVQIYRAQCKENNTQVHTVNTHAHTSAHSEHTCTHWSHKRTHCISRRAGWQPPLQRCTAHYCQAQSIINARHIHKCLITLWSLSFNYYPHCGQNQFETPVIFVRLWTCTTVCGRTQNAKLLFPATSIITSAATCVRKYNWLHSSVYLLDHSPSIALHCQLFSG